MFHDDLSLYTNKEYRSSYYLEKCWKEIEEKVLFFIGSIKNPILSIYFESDCICLTVISNKDIIYQDYIQKKFSHSLNICDDFIVSVVLNPLIEKNNKYNCTYSFVRDTDDEGIVELISDYIINVKNYKEIKNIILLKLCLEIQYAINRNIFNYKISNKLNKSDIDSFYELVYFNSKIKNITLNESLEELRKNNSVSSDIYTELLILIKEIEEHNVQTES